MPTFEVIHLKEIIGTIKVFKLSMDGSTFYDDFCQEISTDGNIEKQLIVISSRLDDVANRRSLPFQKFKDITPSKEKVKEYEIKTSDLRVYLIKDDIGNIIIVGGKKNSQKKDISKFRSIKKTYLEHKMQERYNLLKRPEYWFEQAQNELYRQATEYMENEKINQNELAERLGVTKGYVSQILNGNSNFTIKKLIEIALSMDRIPEIKYKAIQNKVEEELNNQVIVAEFKQGITTKPQILKVAYKHDNRFAAA